MSRNTSDGIERIVKVPFPVALIRRMDEAIVADRGGFRTRTELMREAVENLLNELDFPDASPNELSERTAVSEVGPIASKDQNPAREELDDDVGSLPSWERDELVLADLASTAIGSPAARPYTFSAGVAAVADEPLLGLHNRDYVSLWALGRLARYTEDGPIPWDDFMSRVTRAAWYVGAQLQTLEARGEGKKLTVLLPTNATKRPSAERGFQNFAIGALVRRGEQRELHGHGPLFGWHAIQVQGDQGMPTALTESGWHLLGEMSGASLDLPHAESLREKFLDYLREHAPADFWGFQHLASAISNGADRSALLKSFGSSHPAWTASMASSVAQGYVARAREWGLVEPRLLEGRYWLTAAGRQFTAALDKTDQLTEGDKA